MHQDADLRFWLQLVLDFGDWGAHLQALSLDRLKKIVTAIWQSVSAITRGFPSKVVAVFTGTCCHAATLQRDAA